MIDLLEETEGYVKNLFENIPDNLIYHQLSHTIEVVEAARTIGQAIHLSPEEMQILLLSAWFHDTGYLKTYLHHEEESIHIARQFFNSINANSKLIEQIAGCINATKVPQKPKTKIEEAVCDADMFHLAQDNFCDKSKLLFEEMNATSKFKMDMIAFRKGSVEFFDSHHYHSKYGKEVLSIGKKRNRKHLIELIG
ncbi:MAG: HD domain-containing protein [Bacteroidales bacterium]|nr:HD domain-containing protein [Bacteroidales bacterium]MCF8457735.1 HD domain-containing protein [Bacteroidales bacterium]